MLPILPMIMSLVGQKKQEEEAQKQNSVAAMLGKVPQQQAQPAGGEILGAVGGMLGGMGGQKQVPKPDAMGAVDDALNSYDKAHGEPDGDEERDYSSFL